MILKYYGHKILIKHCNTAKEPNNLASAVTMITGLSRTPNQNSIGSTTVGIVSQLLNLGPDQG